MLICTLQSAEHLCSFSIHVSLVFLTVLCLFIVDCAHTALLVTRVWGAAWAGECWQLAALTTALLIAKGIRPLNTSLPSQVSSMLVCVFVGAFRWLRDFCVAQAPCISQPCNLNETCNLQPPVCMCNSQCTCLLVCCMCFFVFLLCLACSILIAYIWCNSAIQIHPLIMHTFTTVSIHCINDNMVFMMQQTQQQIPTDHIQTYTHRSYTNIYPPIMLLVSGTINSWCITSIRDNVCKQHSMYGPVSPTVQSGAHVTRLH
jgi:hypothetical protein